MTNHTATQEVTISVSGDSFDLDATINVKVNFRVLPSREATLESPAEEASAEITSFSFAVVSDPAKICNPALLEAISEAFENSGSWLIAEAAEADVEAEDDRADALREERMLEDR